MIVTRSDEWHERLRFVQNAVGAVPGPFDCFLVHRGLRTLHLRMAAHARSAAAVAELLRSSPGVSDVRWPGFSGMVSFRHPDATQIASSTRLFTLAESLGGVESLIEVPQAMTHQSVEDSVAAVPPDLVRLSCGVEDPDDLVEDLAGARASRRRRLSSARRRAVGRGGLRREHRPSSRCGAWWRRLRGHRGIPATRARCAADVRDQRDEHDERDRADRSVAQVQAAVGRLAEAVGERRAKRPGDDVGEPEGDDRVHAHDATRRSRGSR